MDKLEKAKQRIEAQIAVAKEIGSDFINLTAGDGKIILKALEEQQKVIEQYHRADGFLAVHGWKWN